MIKIKEIHIKRFRSIMDMKFQIDLENNYITICGENNSGKTNSLRALNLFFNDESFEPEKDCPHHKFYGSYGGAVFPNITVVFFDDKNQKYTKIIKNFSNEDVQIIGSEKNIEDRNFNKDLSKQECINFLQKIYFFFIESINVSYPQIINNLVNEIFDITYNNSRFTGAKKELRVAYDNYKKGLLEILTELSNDINPLFQEYKEDWCVEFDIENDIKKFRDIISDDVNFIINDKSNKHISSKGSGLQRLGFILLLFKVTEKLKYKNVILTIDEPDIFLHDKLQKKLNKDLISISNNSQLFITTHSRNFINTYSLKNVFLLELFISDEKKYSRSKGKDFYELKTKLVDINETNGDQKIKSYLGINDSEKDILNNYNILVEGASDARYLEKLGSFFNLPIPNIIVLGGADNAERYINFYNNYYHELDRKPSILLLLDYDNKGREIYQKINKQQTQNKFQNLILKVEYVPNFLNDNERKNNTNHEIEDFIYPELICYLTNILLH